MAFTVICYKEILFYKKNQNLQKKSFSVANYQKYFSLPKKEDFK
jgi:hypothetical protein